MTDSRTLGQSVPKEGLFLMDGIEGLRSLPKHSVDMLLTDPPYGTTRNYWDVPLPLPELWEAVKWAVKPNGAVLFFGNVILPFVDHFPKDLELYRILTTRLSEVAEAQKHE